MKVSALGSSRIQATFSNEESGVLAFLRYHTPLDGMEADLFRVERAGELVAYSGRFAFRGKPSLEDWVTLKPRESVTVSLDLAEFYDLERPGAYTVKFSYPVCVREWTSGESRTGADDEPYYADTYAYGSGDVESGIADVMIEQPQATAEVSTYRGLAARANGDCSPAQRQVIQTAFSMGKALAAKTASALKRGGWEGTYGTWFGAHSDPVYEKVKSNFQKISATFGRTWNYHCTSCQKGIVAYVYPSRPFQVWVCDYFHESHFTALTRGSVLLHESSHWKASAATVDHGYGVNYCKNLAKSDPAKAADNADNYRFASLEAGE